MSSLHHHRVITSPSPTLQHRPIPAPSPRHHRAIPAPGGEVSVDWWPEEDELPHDAPILGLVLSLSAITLPPLYHHHTITVPPLHHHHHCAPLGLLHTVTGRSTQEAGFMRYARARGHHTITAPSLHHHRTSTAPSLHRHCCLGWRPCVLNRRGHSGMPLRVPRFRYGH